MVMFLNINHSHQLLKDLSDLSKLLSVCANKLHTNPEYCEILCRLIELCGLPFLKEKASDENTYAPQVVEVLTTMGHLVCGENEPVRVQVAKAVAAFCTEQPNQALIEGMSHISSRSQCYHTVLTPDPYLGWCNCDSLYVSYNHVPVCTLAGLLYIQVFR